MAKTYIETLDYLIAHIYDDLDWQGLDETSLLDAINQISDLRSI